jgi:hypothetical protein
LNLTICDHMINHGYIAWHADSLPIKFLQVVCYLIIHQRPKHMINFILLMVKQRACVNVSLCFVNHTYHAKDVFGGKF